MYVVKDGPDTVAFYNNVYDALEAASIEANGNGIIVNCSIPQSGGKSKTFYTCTSCGFPVTVNGSTNTSDFEKYSQDVYAYCDYCDVHFVIVWMRNRYLPE